MTEILFKALSFAIIGAAMEVHKILGPGFLESVYQAALEKELTLRGIPFQHQVELPVSYKGDVIGVYKAALLLMAKSWSKSKEYPDSMPRTKRKPFTTLPQLDWNLPSLSILAWVLWSIVAWSSQKIKFRANSRNSRLKIFEKP